MSRRLTLNQERRMLAEVRQLRLHVDPGELERLLRDQAGVAQHDQMKATQAETAILFATLARALGDDHHELVSPDMGAMLLAGVMRCLAGARCEHAIAGDRPLHALLSARVIACKDCLLRFARRVHASDRRNAAAVGDGRLCDFCLEEPAEFWFKRVTVQFGPALVMGDMCSDCCTTFGVEEAAS